MTGIEIIQEMETLLAAKIEAQEKLVGYYGLIDESVRKVLLENTFDKIDGLMEDIQKLDILFVSKLEKYKTLNGVKDLGELGGGGRKSFIEVKKLVLKAAENDVILSALRDETETLKVGLKRDKIMGSQMSSAASAYNKINKL